MLNIFGRGDLEKTLKNFIEKHMNDIKLTFTQVLSSKMSELKSYLEVLIEQRLIEFKDKIVKELQEKSNNKENK